MSVLKESAYSEFKNGVTTVGQTVTPLVTSPLRIYGKVTLKASADNSGNVFIGWSNQAAFPLTTSNGYKLEPGESLDVPCNDASHIFLIADDDDQTVNWLGA